MKDTQGIMKTRHVPWIDLLRIIAIILVVLCHSSEEGIYELSLQSVTDMRSTDRFFSFFCFTMGRLGVPVFLMISGYLLLDREYDLSATKRFWKKNWMHLVFCTMFWFFAYDLFLIYVKSVQMSVIDVIQDVVFLHKVNMSHVWYMPMIIGLYACIPFAANALKKAEDKSLVKIPMVFFFIVLFIYPAVSLIFRLIDPTIRTMSNQIGSGFIGGTYGVYLIMGWMLKKGFFKKVKCYWLIIILGIAFSVSVLIELWAYSCGIGYNIWYDSPFLFVAAVSLFELISRIKIQRIHKGLQWISSYAFGIYLIHFPFKLLLLDWIIALPYSKKLQVMIMWGVLFGISSLLTMIISTIPKVGNYLLYRK